MPEKYLSLSTDPAHPDQLLMACHAQEPTPDDNEQLRYVARYSDAMRAYLQAETARHNERVDSGRFRIPAEAMIATLESLPLRGERVFMARDIENEHGGALAAEILKLRRRARWRDRIWHWVAYTFVAMLAVRAIAGLMTGQ